MHSPIRLNNGSQREGRTRFGTSGTAPRATTIIAHHGETLGAITLRAYGANTIELQQRITRANASLTGEINVPR